MKEIFKYLWKHKISVLAIIMLLVIQAYCDLSLPSYTSDIVDVGIEQGGIEHEAMDEMREETLDSLCLLMTNGNETIVRDSYQLNDEGIYVLQVTNEEKIEELDTILSTPMVMLNYINSSDDISISNLQQAVDAGKMTKDQILDMEDEALEKYGDISDSIISQAAIQFVQTEYETIGTDMQDLQMKYLLKKGVIMLELSILMMFVAVIAGFIASKTAAKIGRDLRENVFCKVIAFTNGEMDKFSTASLITRSTNDIQQIQMVSVMLLRMVVYAPILGIGGVVKVISTRTGMGWIILVAVGAILVLVSILMRVAMPKFKLMQTLVDKMNLVSREILTGIPVIRAFSREKLEEKRFEDANLDLMKTQLFTNRVMTFMMPIMMFIMNGVTVLIVWVAAHGINVGNLQVGDMIAFITYTMQIVMSFLMLTMVSIMLPRAGVAANRIKEVLDTEVSIQDMDHVKDNEKEFKGEISFQNVNFCYDGAGEDALENISFTAQPGKTTAIIGSTGCGKSTLVHLIPRFYDVTAGKVTMDGIDIRELSQYKLRSLIGFVPQKGILFSGSIESNIKFGGEDISDEEMKEAAEIAQALEFIEEKTQGYQSDISQGGNNVSGGQKQRLSIARAIAKKPKVFLFDDSFSALDYKTDVMLRRKLSEKVKEATVIIVAQRISTILHAEQIIVLEDGKIVGNGTHEELMKNCEAYQEIAKSQLSEAELKGQKGGKA